MNQAARKESAVKARWMNSAVQPAADSYQRATETNDPAVRGVWLRDAATRADTSHRLAKYYPGDDVDMRRPGIAIAFSFAVEIGQLFHPPWLEAVRRTSFGGFVPGFGFVWTDLICYATGVLISAMIDDIAYSKTHNVARNGSTGAA